MKKAIPILFLLLLQGCMTLSRHWELGVCRESASGGYSCAVKVPKCSAIVNLIATIDYGTPAKHIPATSLRIRIENQEPHAIEIQGISPFVLLNPKESYELSVKPNPDINQAYICAINTIDGAARIKLYFLSEEVGGATIRIGALAADGP